MRQGIGIFLISTLILLSIMGCGNNQTNKQGDSKENILSIENILGVWDTVSGYDAENIEFQKEDDGTLIYYSYLNTRPWDNGKWSFTKGALKLESDSGDIFTYKKVEKEGDKLKLTDAKGNLTVFKRESEKISNKEETIKNLKAYINQISAFIGLDNSEPVDTEFKWNLKSGATINVSGLLTEYPLENIAKDDFQSMNEKVGGIGDYLAGLGFAQNVFNTAENQTAYADDSYAFIVGIDTEGATNAIFVKAVKLNISKK